MALTDHSDFYAAIHEGGINSVIKHVMRQRPSLFNYGTALIQAKPDLLCEKINPAPGVTQFVTVQPPIPLFGADQFALNYAFQLADLEIEFHPGNVIDLPKELNPPLKQQRFSFRARGCGGLGCPTRSSRPLVDAVFDEIRFHDKLAFDRRKERSQFPNQFSANVQKAQFVSSGQTAHTTRQTAVAAPANAVAGFQNRSDLSSRAVEASRAQLNPLDFFFPRQHVFPTSKLECFCLDLVAVGQGEIKGPVGSQHVSLKLDDIEIVDLAPVGLENSIECYALLVVNHVIFPQVNEMVSNAMFRLFEVGDVASFKIAASTTAPNNPAFEQDQMKAFINLDEFDVDIPQIVVEEGGDDAPEEPEPEFNKTIRPRVRTGPAHLTAALSEDVFVRVFNSLRDNTTFDIKVEKRNVISSFLKADAHVKFHLDGGNIDFKNTNIIAIDELDIKWDKLQVKLYIDLPKICLPPFKICAPDWVPFVGGECTPQWCFFEGENDITIPINLPTAFTSELSMDLRPKVYYGTNPAGNKWLVELDLHGPVDIDIIDISDTIGDLIDDAIEFVVDALGLPDVVEDAFDIVSDAIRAILDFGDDVGEWFKDLVFDALGIELGIDNLLVKLFADKFDLLKIDDPMEVMPADGPEIPVRIPIEYVGARVNDKEMIIEADIQEA